MGYSRIFKAATLIAAIVFAWTVLTWSPRDDATYILDATRLADLARDATARLVEDPSDANAWRELVNVFRSHDDPEQAARAWVRRAPATLIEDYAGAALAWYWLGWTVAPQDNQVRSIARAAQFLQARPDLRAWEQADRHFEQFFQEAPSAETPLLRMRHGRTLVKIGQAERAADALTRAEELVDERLAGGASSPELLYVLRAVGEAWIEMGNRERGDLAWQRSATLPDRTDGELAGPIDWVTLGRLYRSNESDAAAQLCFDRALAIQERIAADWPSDGAFFDLAICRAEAGDDGGAIEALSLAVDAGFSHRWRLRREDAFDRFRDDPRFLAVVERLPAPTDRAERIGTRNDER